MTKKLNRSGAVPVVRAYQPAAKGKGRHRSFAGFGIEDVARVEAAMRRGETEEWSNLFCDRLLADPHVQSVVETRIEAVASAEIVVEPGRLKNSVDGTPFRGVSESSSEVVADVVREHIIDGIPELESLIHHMLYGRAHGWAVAELNWHRVDGWWVPRPLPVRFPDTQYKDDWSLAVRTHDPDGQSEWIDVDAERDRWCVHEVRKAGKQPVISGDLYACLRPWVYQKWVEFFLLTGLEKQGNGMLYGVSPENAAQEARDALLEGLEMFSADHVGAFENNVQVGVLQSAIDSGAYQLMMGHLKDSITKSILGSTLNTEIGAAGGNRAAAESQGGMTMLPRFMADARAVSRSLERDVIEPFLRFNATRFAGAPVAPSISFKLTQDEPIEINETALKTGLIKADQYLQSIGLEPLGPDAGGNEFVRIEQASPTPAFTNKPAEVGTPRPLHRAPTTGVATMSRATTSKTLPMYSGLISKILREPSPTSGDPES